MNIFDVVGENFFKPLTSHFKHIYLDCLTIIYDSYRSELSYGFDREILVSKMSDYANYLMGRVVLCYEVIELKQYPIAITAGCMLYQGKGLRKIPEDIYRIPYIGKSAIARQLEIAEADYKAIGEQCYTLEARIKEIDTALDYIGECDLGAIERYLSSPIELDEIKKKIQKTAAELKDAQNDPMVQVKRLYSFMLRSIVHFLTTI